jgi:hypothetical protein
VFAACVFLIFSWSILWFFQRVPGWLPYLNVWDIAGILAYTQAFALLESLATLLVILLVAILLPARWCASAFTAYGGTLVLALGFWAALLQLIFDVVIADWTGLEFIGWFGLALVSIVVACVLVRRSRRIARAIEGLLERLTIFLYIYVPLGLIGALVVLFRNVT